MGSIAAMENGSKDRYFQSDAKMDASVALLTACAMNVDKWDWSWNSVNECPVEKPAKAAKTAAKPAKAAAKKKKAK